MLSAEAAARPNVRLHPSEQEVALLREFKARHYESWPDGPLPALDELTPREAMQRPEMRSRLDLILRDIEHHEARLPEWERYDIAKIRAALGLTPTGRIKKRQ